MSRTTVVEDDKGRTWFVIHNSDWSGDVTLRPGTEEEDAVEARVPGSVLHALARVIASREVLERVERSVEEALLAYERGR